MLVLAVPSVALCQWTRALLQISNQLPSLLVSQLIYAGVVLGASGSFLASGSRHLITLREEFLK